MQIVVMFLHFMARWVLVKQLLYMRCVMLWVYRERYQALHFLSLTNIPQLKIKLFIIWIYTGLKMKQKLLTQAWKIVCTPAIPALWNGRKKHLVFFLKILLK